MAAAVSARWHLQLTVEETVAVSQDLGVADPVIVHRIASSSGTADANSTPAATKVWSDTRTLAAGTDTIDLTAMTRSPLATVDFTGLRVRYVKLKAASANTAVVVVADGASNGYTLFGDASGQVSLPAGGEFLMKASDVAGAGLPLVSSTAKNVTVTSSDTDAIWSVILVAG